MWLRRAALAAFLASMAGVGVSAAGPPDNRPIAYPNSVAFGAYDPHGDFTTDKNVKIEALFLPWQDVDLSNLAKADDYARERGRSIVISIEPWTWAKNEHIQPRQLLSGILRGAYDGNMLAISRIAGKFVSPTTIRWAQEMEDPRGRFSWQGWSGEEYKAAYRHMVDVARTVAPNAKFMWSPKGMPGLDKYYPGDAYVDSIGLSVFGLQRYDRDNFRHDRSFAEILKPGYDLVLKYKKPIYVAEAGYVGDKDYVQKWADAMLKPDAQFPKLNGVIYFDDKEVAPWPPHYGLPDWRVTSNIVP
jgi:beta-mannanase